MEHWRLGFEREKSGCLEKGGEVMEMQNIFKDKNY